MTSDELQNQLSQTWYREQSADDAHATIWGRPFDGCTFPLSEKERLERENAMLRAQCAAYREAIQYTVSVDKILRPDERHTRLEELLSLAND